MSEIHQYADYLLTSTPLANFDKEAAEGSLGLSNSLPIKGGITEQLKADNQMLWIGCMNNNRNRGTEIINSKLIYVKK